jgi:hypothetical protein
MDANEHEWPRMSTNGSPAIDASPIGPHRGGRTTFAAR